MNKVTCICLVSIICLYFLTSSAAWAMSPEVQQLMREGVALHNIGQYSAAIDTYLQALALQPDDPVIHYELGYSYMASKQYDQCIEVTQKGLSLQPDADIEPGLYVLQGSCYSTNNQIEEALAAFRTGLAKYPNHTGLNYNIAITLTKAQQYAEAITYTHTALLQSPDYSSPYFLLAQLYEAQTELVSSLAFYLRFAMLEQNTTRTRFTAYRAYLLANIGIVVEKDGEYYVRRSTDDTSTLHVGLKIAMLSQEADATKSEATRFVDGLTSFVQICSELNDEAIRHSLTWKHALADLVTMHKDGYLDEFLYYLASLNDLPGAAEWLQAHPNATKDLLNYLQ